MFYVNKNKQYFIFTKNFTNDYIKYIGLKNPKGYLHEPLIKIKINNEVYYYTEENDYEPYYDYNYTTNTPSEIICRKKYYYEIKPNLTRYYLDYFKQYFFQIYKLNFVFNIVYIYFYNDNIYSSLLEIIQIPLYYIYLPLLFDIPYKDYKINIIFPKKTKQTLVKNLEIYNEMYYPNLKIQLPAINILQQKFIPTTFCDSFTYYIESMYELNFVGKFLVPLWFLQKQFVYTNTGNSIILDTFGWDFFFDKSKIKFVLFYDKTKSIGYTAIPYQLFNVYLNEDNQLVLDDDNNFNWLEEGKTYFYMPIAIATLDNPTITLDKHNNIFKQPLNLRILSYV